VVNKKVMIAFAVMVSVSGSAFAGGDAAAGKGKSAACVACHGPSGVSTSDLWPNLAGQKQAYIMKQLKAFREGTRTDPLMSGMAKPLSDEDIENLAAYFSSQSAAPAVAQH
jgi:cytochrome c553